MPGPYDRIIRKSFWSSPSVAKCTPVQRLLFIGLWAMADEHGRGECNLKTLEGAIFPNDSIPELVGDQLATFGGQWRPMAAAFDVLTYEVDGRVFFEIPNWGRHQRLRKGRESSIPDPTRGNAVVLDAGGHWRPLAANARLEGEGEGEEPPTVVGGSRGGASLVPVATGSQVATPAAVGKPTAATKRGTRLPDGWTPNPDLPANQRLHAMHSREWLSDQLERFRDYWGAKTGKDATKTDWDATWRNWIKRSADQERPRQTPEAARIQAMYADASTRDVSIFQQIIDADDARRRQAS